MTDKLTIEDMRKRATAKEGKCLSTIYVNKDTKLTWTCKEGHTWDASPHNIKAGSWCPICAHKNPWNKGRISSQVAWNKGKPMSEQLKKKLSESLKGRTAWNKGIKTGKSSWNKGLKTGIAPWKGKHRSEETIKKTREATIKRWQNPEYRTHMSEVLKGHVVWNKGKKYSNPKLLGHLVSEETKRKMREAKKVNPPSYWLGKHRSEETRKKLSEATKKTMVNPEIRRKLSEALKGRPSAMKGKKTGKPSWMKGKHHTGEAKRKMSEARLRGINEGRIISSVKGKHHSAKAIEKQSASLKKMYQLHPELREKMSQTSAAIWRTPEKRKFASERRLKQVFPMKDTKLEIAMQNELTKRGINFQTHKAILGQPDIFIEPNICIFCDGDYWHANPDFYTEQKIIKRGQSAKQIWEKDKKVTTELIKQRFLVLRFWESDVKKDVAKCVDKIEKQLKLHGK